MIESDRSSIVSNVDALNCSLSKESKIVVDQFKVLVLTEGASSL